MNKVIFAIIALVIVALAGGVFLSNGSDEEVASNTQQDVSTETEANTDNESIEVESAGTRGIVAYSEEALANSETDDNLLFFHAKWCSVCNSVERNIEAGSIPDSLTILKVDYDSDEGQALAKKYNIPIQYSMVQVDTTGAELTQWVNSFSDGIDEISNNLI